MTRIFDNSEMKTQVKYLNKLIFFLFDDISNNLLTFFTFKVPLGTILKNRLRKSCKYFENYQRKYTKKYRNLVKVH